MDQMRSRIPFLAIVPIVAVAVAVGCRHGGSAASPAGGGGGSQLADRPNAKVVALGRLQPAGGVVTISAIPGERLEKIHVREGDHVVAGQVLAQLASYDPRAAQVRAIEHRQAVAPQRWKSKIAVAEAQIAQAKAALEQAKVKQQEVELQQPMVELLQRQAQRAEVTYHKLVTMSDDDSALSSDRELERYELQRDRASVDHQQAKKRYNLARITADKAVEAAEANVVTAQASLAELKLADPEPEIVDQLELARIQRDTAQLRAPIGGKVLKVYLEEGEVITDRPVMLIANLDQMVCIAEVYEADAKKIKAEKVVGDDPAVVTAPGDDVRILSMAFDDKFADGIPGTVEHVGSLVAPPGLESRNPLAPADRSVVEVRIRIGTGAGGEANPSQSDNAALDKQARLNRQYNQQAAELVSLQVKVEFRDRETGSK